VDSEKFIIRNLKETVLTSHVLRWLLFTSNTIQSMDGPISCPNLVRKVCGTNGPWYEWSIRGTNSPWYEKSRHHLMYMLMNPNRKSQLVALLPHYLLIPLKHRSHRQLAT